MKDINNTPCDCNIKGKQYDENDETCIRCKRAQAVLDVLLDIAIKRAVDHGDLFLLETLLDSKK